MILNTNKIITEQKPYYFAFHNSFFHLLSVFFLLVSNQLMNFINNFFYVYFLTKEILKLKTIKFILVFFSFQMRINIYIYICMIGIDFFNLLKLKVKRLFYLLLSIKKNSC